MTISILDLPENSSDTSPIEILSDSLKKKIAEDITTHSNSNCLFDILYIVCGNVPDVQNGIWKATGYNIGSQAQLVCENGYLAIGDNVSYCNSNWRWTNNYGRCEKCKF